MVRVKICGITNLKDALAAAQNGCDAVGFIFYKKSPRYISSAKASQICRALPKRIKKIGVFVNAPEVLVKKTVRDCRLDMVQLHGDESPAYCNKLSGLVIIKAFRVGEDFHPGTLKQYHGCQGFLFDAFSPRAYGGTGCKFNWGLLKDIPRNKKIFLSGGLNSKNIKKAIIHLSPDWVDISSAIEVAPGLKDHRLMKEFIHRVKLECLL